MEEEKKASDLPKKIQIWNNDSEFSEIFKQIDKDNDKLISIAELEVYMQKNNIQYNKELIQAFSQMIQKDLQNQHKDKQSQDYLLSNDDFCFWSKYLMKQVNLDVSCLIKLQMYQWVKKTFTMAPSKDAKQYQQQQESSLQQHQQQQSSATQQTIINQLNNPNVNSNSISLIFGGEKKEYKTCIKSKLRISPNILEKKKLQYTTLFQESECFVVLKFQAASSASQQQNEQTNFPEFQKQFKKFFVVLQSTNKQCKELLSYCNISYAYVHPFFCIGFKIAEQKCTTFLELLQTILAHLNQNQLNEKSLIEIQIENGLKELVTQSKIQQQQQQQRLQMLDLVLFFCQNCKYQISLFFQKILENIVKELFVDSKENKYSEKVRDILLLFTMLKDANCVLDLHNFNMEDFFQLELDQLLQIDIPQINLPFQNMVYQLNNLFSKTCEANIVLDVQTKAANLKISIKSDQFSDLLKHLIKM